ncbi:lambda exonuclease family protein [Robbsia andropogonis]|uniref:lambda exonuclease family protein n=1 Tax=Robbsia andropogonis TaxID=28092 RepID=UPI003D1CCA26
MRLIHCDQGSPEWHQARAGCITASMFKVARQRVDGLDEKQQAFVDARLSGLTESEAMAAAGYRQMPRADAVFRAIAGEPVGKPSEKAMNYAFRLAVERISGVPLDEGYETWQMRRGHELEPMARAAHEIEAGVIVDRAGSVATDDGLFGASADGFIGKDGGSEYKCLVSPEGLRNVLLHNDISEFEDQIQGCMWITERTWWHFALYCPALESIGKHLYWCEVKRDDDYIEALEKDLIEFERLVSHNHALLVKQAA